MERAEMTRQNVALIVAVPLWCAMVLTLVAL